MAKAATRSQPSMAFCLLLLFLSGVEGFGVLSTRIPTAAVRSPVSSVVTQQCRGPCSQLRLSEREDDANLAEEWKMQRLRAEDSANRRRLLDESTFGTEYQIQGKAECSSAVRQMRDEEGNFMLLTSLAFITSFSIYIWFVVEIPVHIDRYFDYRLAAVVKHIFSQ